MSKIENVKKKMLVSMLIIVVLLSGLLVFPASATSAWSKPRPSSDTPYDEVVGNVNDNNIAALAMGVHIGAYHENDPVVGDFLTLRVSASANVRKGINYQIWPFDFHWYDVYEQTNIKSDGTWVPLNLPFAVLYHGVEYDKLWVYDDGFISFDPNPVSTTPKNIPDTSNPNSIVAPFWRDLDPSLGGSITYGSIIQTPWLFVISWNGVPNKSTPPCSSNISDSYKRKTRS